MLIVESPLLSASNGLDGQQRDHADRHERGQSRAAHHQIFDRCHLALPSAGHVGAAAYVGSGLPACSATMYSAYQSGQFTSYWPPVRFSCSPCAAAARRSAAASSVDEVNVVTSASTRPGNRAVTSCSSQPLPSGSLNVANEE